MKKIIHFVFAFVILPSLLLAGVIGKVTDTKGKSLGGVKISNSKGTEVYSNAFGLYEIEASSLDELKFTYTKKQDVLVTVGKRNLINVTMKDKIIEEIGSFDVVVATAGKVGQKVSEIPASVVIITHEEIINNGYSSLEEILRNVPGLYSIDEYDWTGSGSNFGVRGFLSNGMNNEMILQVNGVNQIEDYWGFYPLSRINVPVEAIERIEVVRGPLSVIYGSGAFLGAINVITHPLEKSDLFEDRKNHVTLSYGTDKKRLTSKLVSPGAFSYTLTGSFEKNDGPDMNFNEIVSASDWASYRGLRQSSKSLLKSDKVFLNISTNYRDTLFFNLNYGQAEQHMFLNTGNLNITIPSGEGTLARMNGLNASLTHRKMFSEEFITMTSELNFSNHRSFMDYAEGGDYLGFSSFLSSAFEGEYGFVFDFEKISQQKVLLSTGLFYRSAYDLHTTFDLPIFGAGSTNQYRKLSSGDSLDTWATFIQSDWEVSEYFSLVLGARVEKVMPYTIVGGTEGPKNSLVERMYDYKADAAITPRAALIYKIDTNNIIKGMYGQAIKRPSFGQNTDMIFGTDILTPAKISTYELNYINTYKLKTSQLSSSVSLFRNELSDLIGRVSVASGGGIEYQSQNQGEVFTHGIETGVKINSKKWSFDLSITYQKSENETRYFTDSSFNEATIPELSFSPQWLAYQKTTYRFNDKFLSALNLRYVGSMYPEFDITIDSTGEAVGFIGPEVESYSLVDLHFRYQAQFGKQPMEISLKAQNLLDEDYHNPSTRNNNWADLGFLGLGRHFLLSTTFKF